MVVDCRPDPNIPWLLPRPIGAGLPIDGAFAVDGNLVYCKMQVTGLQYYLHHSISFMGSRCVVTNAFNNGMTE